MRRISTGQEALSDSVALFLSTALDPLSMQKIPAKKPEGAAFVTPRGADSGRRLWHNPAQRGAAAHARLV